jgi:hypothetical protein
VLESNPLAVLPSWLEVAADFRAKLVVATAPGRGIEPDARPLLPIDTSEFVNPNNFLRQLGAYPFQPFPLCPVTIKGGPAEMEAAGPATATGIDDGEWGQLQEREHLLVSGWLATDLHLDL